MINPKIYFSADYHFNHVNILNYENRPFATVEEMNNTIIENHNKTVKPEDVCYVVGDIYFRGGIQAKNCHYYEFLKRMNGRLVIIKGNHDSKSNKIIDAIQSASMCVSGLKIFCVHDPINATTKYNLVLCGHVHSAWLATELIENNKKSLIINCGVDVWNYKPVEWKKLEALYNQWKCGKLKVPVFDKEALRQLRANRRK